MNARAVVIGAGANELVAAQVLARGGWNSEQEKNDTLAYLEEARAKFRALAAGK